MPLDKGFQKILISRLEQLSEEEVLALRDGIPPQIAEILMYKVLPEIDFLFQAMPQMRDREFNPERTLDGEALQEFSGAGMVEGGAPPPQDPNVGGLGELQNVGNPQGGLA